MDWISDVVRMDREHAERAEVQKTEEARILARDEAWVREVARPAMERFAADLRGIGREVRVEDSGSACRVEVGPPDDPTFVASVAPEGEAGTQVRTTRDHERSANASYLGGRGEEQVYERLASEYVRSLNPGPGDSAEYIA